MLDILAMEKELHRPVVVGMIHLKPLSGAPRFEGVPGDMEGVIDAALRDAKALAAGGVDAVIVENFGDVPFFPDRVPSVTVAAMTRCVSAVCEALDIPVGVNVLRNDVEAALSIAEVCCAQFVRANILTGAMLTDQGIIGGKAHDIMRLRSAMCPDVAILADVLVKHAAPLVESDPVGIAVETVERGMADGIIITGSRTGAQTDPALLKQLKFAVEAPVIVGSGVTRENLDMFLGLPGRADAFIVGSHFKENYRPDGIVDETRVREFMNSVR